MIQRATMVIAMAVLLGGAQQLPASDAEGPWYVSVGFGELENDWLMTAAFGEDHIGEAPPGSLPIPVYSFAADYDTRGDQFAIGLGREVGRYLSVETRLSDAHLGQPIWAGLLISDAGYDVDVSLRRALTAGLAVAPRLPISSRWSLFGKLGWHYQRLDFGLDANLGFDPGLPTVTIDGGSYGGGVRWSAPSRLDFFVEYESRDVDTRDVTGQRGHSVRGSSQGVLIGSAYRW